MITSIKSTTDQLDIVCAKVTFKKAPIHILEQFTFKNLQDTYQQILKESILNECLILETCNRVEVFGITQRDKIDRLVDYWSKITDIPRSEIIKYADIELNEQVLKHILQLTSGLDSLVLGEDQILGQVKRAVETAKRNNALGPVLTLLFDRAIKTGAKVRSKTGINKGSISVGSMAVNIADRYFDDLSKKKIMIIGSGEGASLVAKSLKQRRVDFLVTSRTYQRAKAFTETMGGFPIIFDKALEMLNELDIVFVSTTAPYYLLTYDRIAETMRNRCTGLMLFDLSNPRTIDEKVSSINKVKLINMDNIAELIDKNLSLRKKEVNQAEVIIEGEAKSITTLLRRQEIEPTIISIFKNADAIRMRELDKAMDLLGNTVTTSQKRIIEQMTYAITEGIISLPMNNLRKEFDKNEHKKEILNFILKIFNESRF